MEKGRDRERQRETEGHTEVQTEAQTETQTETETDAGRGRVVASMRNDEWELTRTKDCSFGKGPTVSPNVVKQR